MMTALLATLAGVLSTAILGALGWFVKLKIEDRARIRAKDELELQQLRIAVAEIRDYILTSKISDLHLETDVAQLKRQMPQTMETLAVVAAEFENHQLWHERQSKA